MRGLYEMHAWPVSPQPLSNKKYEVMERGQIRCRCCGHVEGAYVFWKRLSTPSSKGKDNG